MSFGVNKAPLLHSERVHRYESQIQKYNHKSLVVIIQVSSKSTRDIRQQAHTNKANCYALTALKDRRVE
jgi:hypothetical protein